MARAIDAYSHHMPYYLSMTGTPVKNDASEAFDVLKKLHPRSSATERLPAALWT
jgi:hypothetical protein